MHIPDKLRGGLEFQKITWATELNYKGNYTKGKAKILEAGEVNFSV